MSLPRAHDVHAGLCTEPPIGPAAEQKTTVSTTEHAGKSTSAVEDSLSYSNGCRRNIPVSQIHPPQQQEDAMQLRGDSTNPGSQEPLVQPGRVHRNRFNNSKSELWEEAFDENGETEEIEDPQSSSALLFAKLGLPRVSGADREDGFGRSIKAGVATRKLEPEQHVLESDQSVYEKPDAHETEQLPSWPAQVILDQKLDAQQSFPALKIANHIASSKQPDSSLPVTTDDSSAPAPSQKPVVLAHTVIENVDLSDSDEDPNADLSLEESCGNSLVQGARNENDVGGANNSEQLNISRLQEIAYVMADSVLPVLWVALIIIVDHMCFFYALTYMQRGLSRPAKFLTVYTVIDIITAVSYCVEVNLRLFSYGREYYFHSWVRGLDYSVCMMNTGFVILRLALTNGPRWLLVSRYIRLARFSFVSILQRERRVKLDAIQELEELARLLETERSEQNRLIKWRIDSTAIAMGEAAGKGGFGAVFLGLFRGTLVAIKQLYQNNDKAAEYTSIEDEAVTLVNLRHPNVVLFMGFVHEPDKLWIVTEYCSRGSLRDLLDNNKLSLTQSRILKFALGAARGLAYLHGQDPPVLHLDLKTSNILISSGWDTKLADFGLSRNIDNIQNNTFAGTIQYSAPEILESNTFSVAADIYSFGICLWEMAARDIPFDGISPMEVLWGVVKEQLRPPIDVITKQPSVRMPIDPTAVPQVSEVGASSQPEVYRTPSILDSGEQPSTETLIDAAVVVASGCVRKAETQRIRLSLPSVQNLENSETDSMKRYVKSNPNLDAIMSPVSEAPGTPFPVNDTPTSQSSHMLGHLPSDWVPSYISPVPIHKSDLESDRPTKSALDRNSFPLKTRGKMSHWSNQSNRNSGSTKSSGASSPVGSQASLGSRQSLSSNPALGKEERLIRRVTRISATRAAPVKKFSRNGASGADFDASHGGQSPTKGRNSNDQIVTEERSPNNNDLDALTSKLTAKIQLLDDRPSVAKRSPKANNASTIANVGMPPAAIATKVIDAFRLKRGSGDDPRYLEDRHESDISSFDAGSTMKKRSWGIPDGSITRGRSGGRVSDSSLSRHRSAGTGIWADGAASGSTTRGTNMGADTFQRRLESFSTLPVATSPRSTQPAVDGLGVTGADEIEMATRSELASTDTNAMGGSAKDGAVLMSEEYVDLIKRCWSQDPSERPSADELVWRLVAIIDGQIRNTATSKMNENEIQMD